MGDVRFERAYERVASARDASAVIRGLSDDEVVAALGAAASRHRQDPYLANVLATEVQNRLRRAHAASAHLGEGVIAVDTRGIVTLLNPAAERLLARRAADLVGRDLHESVHRHRLDGSAYPREACPLMAVMSTHEVWTGDDEIFERPDGSAFPVGCTAAPVFAEDGDVRGAVVVFRDWTAEVERERRRAARHAVAEALASSPGPGEAGASVLEAIGKGFRWEVGAFWTRDEANGRLRCAAFWRAPGVAADALERESRERAYGPGEGIPGRIWATADVVWEEDFEAWEARDAPRVRAARRDGFRSVVGFPCPVGRDPRAAIELYGTERRTLDADELDALRTLGASVGEFVERKLAEARLRASEEKYRSVFRSVRDAIVVADTRRGIIDCNPAFELLVGHTLDELRGKTPRVFYASEEQYQETGRILRENMGSDESIVLHRLFRRKSGDEFVAEVSASYVRDSAGSVVGFMGVVRDVTERERLAAVARRRIEEVAETVHAVEHAVGEHAARTGEGERAPDMPLAHEAAHKTEAARRAAMRAERQEDP